MAAFSTQTYGKWILAGEHSVIRGSSALVFPFFEKKLTLEFSPGGVGLTCDFHGENGEELRLLFWGVVEKALSSVGRSRDQVTGRFRLESNVPVGAGLGASATLCAAVGRWLAWQNWITAEQVYDVSRDLENMFHGESSGVDIAVALAGQPLEFRRGLKPQVIKPKWQPNLYISYSGVRGLTSECVKRVQQFLNDNEQAGKQIDQKMNMAVDKAKKALLNVEDAMQRLFLTQAMNEAATCFDAWGLTHGDLGAHLELLKKSGALAAKPTGSGQGGFVLSLWDKKPAVEGVNLQKLPLFVPAAAGAKPAEPAPGL